MTGENEAVISVRDLVKVYGGDTRAVDGITFDVAPGELFGFLGPNGAGKTTTIRILATLLRASSGAARVAGFDVATHATEVRKRLGLVSHDLQHEYMDGVPLETAVVAGFAGSQALAGVPFQPTAEHLARARVVIHELGLAGLEERPFGTLSTGEQRRCLLARALVHRPDALILDEPTAGLDPQAAFSLLARIRRLIRKGTTIVLVTHHVNEIPPEVDRVVLLKDGRVIADGAKRELLTAERLGALYGVPVRIVESEGFFVALPG